MTSRFTFTALDWAKVVKCVWFFAVVVGLAYFAIRYADVIVTYLSAMSLATGFSVLVLIILCKLATMTQMAYSLNLVGQPAYLDEQLCLYSYSDITKYIPGGIWGIVGRLAMYRRRKMPVLAITQAMLVEHAWLVGGSCLAGLALWLAAAAALPEPPNAITSVFRAAHLEHILEPALWVLAGLALCGLPIFAFVSTLLLRVVPAGPYKLMIPVALQAAIWIPAGLSFAILLPLPADYVATLALGAGAFAVAFGVGMIAVFAPAGIGVREALVAALVWPVVSPEIAVTACITNRLLWFLADMLFAGLAWFRTERIGSRQ